MVGKTKKNEVKDAVVKIDSDLLKQVEEFIARKENQFKYSSKKQFIDLAVFEKLMGDGK